MAPLEIERKKDPVAETNCFVFCREGIDPRKQ